MSHPFGELLWQHLIRKQGLSQNKLAMGVNQDPAVITRMRSGQALTGPQSRERITQIIGWLHEQGVLNYVEEANALLAAADKPELSIEWPREARLLQTLTSQASVPVIPLPMPRPIPRAIPPCPYRGLFAFREEDAAFFCGREVFTDRLVAGLCSQHKPMMVVIGPSGSGKSSVVFAGLAPRLRQAGGWTIVSFRPGERPFHGLAAALVPLLEPRMSETDRLIEINKMAESLAFGSLSLLNVVRRIIEKNPSTNRLLLIGDQFEEVYALCRDTDERQRFLDRLITAVSASTPHKQTKSPLTLLITIRADFLGPALAYRPMVDALQGADLKLGSMSRQELQEAIETPASQSGVEIEEGLTERILDAVGEEPGDLPLLEFALTLLWARQKDGKLTHAAYDEIGGIEKALAGYAEEVYEDLSEGEQQQAMRIFTQLVQPGEATEDTRRQANRSEVREDNWDLVTRLADARLVISDRNEATGEETVEIAHEAMIGGWDRLREWVEADRKFRTWQERLRAALHQWESSGKDDGALLRGAPLLEAEQWLQERQTDLSQSEQHFVQAGIALQEREHIEATARKEHELQLAQQAARAERRAANRLRYLALALAVFALIAVVLSAWAIDRSQVAADSVTHSDALRLAAEANGLLQSQGSAELAALISIRSIGEHYTPQGDAALTGASTLEYASQVFTGPDIGGVFGVAFSPDGKYALTGHFDRNARLWDISTGKMLRLFEHTKTVPSVAFSPDGKYILTGSGDYIARLWDAASGKEVRQFVGHTNEVRDVAFSPDGKYVLTASLDNTARLWDVTTGKEIRRFARHQQAVFSAAFSPDGKYVLTGSQDETARLWDVSTGQEMRVFNTSGVLAVAFAPNGKTVLTGGYYGAVQLWDAVTGQELHKLVGHTNTVQGVAFSPDGKLALTGSDDKTVRLWDAATGQELRQYRRVSLGVSRVSFSPDGSTALFGSGDGKARLWDLKIQPGLPRFVGHTDILQDAVFSPDGKRILTTSPDKTARLWDAATGKEIRQFVGHIDGLGLGVFSPDGKYVLTGSFDKDKTARLWDTATGHEIRKFVGHTDVVYGVAFSPDGKQALTASWDYTARLWDVATGKELQRFVGHTGHLDNAVFTPDGKRVVTGGAEGNARLWDAATGKEIRRFAVDTDPIVSIAASPDGKYIVTGSYAGAARLWDVATGKEIANRLPGASAVLWSVAFSPDGKQVLAASGDKSARLWDFQTGAELRRFTGHTADVETASFSPDGKYIVTASDDRTARLWNTDYHPTISYLCERLKGRDLTDDERRQFEVTDNSPTCSALAGKK